MLLVSVRLRNSDEYIQDHLIYRGKRLVHQKGLKIDQRTGEKLGYWISQIDESKDNQKITKAK